MSNKQIISHPYIPNTVEKVRQSMLETIGVKEPGDLYVDIPAAVKLNEPLDLPEALSEFELKRHVEGMLAKNVSCGEKLSFLGAGCYQHHVPSVCKEIGSRGEFVTAYDAGYYADQGKYQAVFEYLSMMAELLESDVVSITYDGHCAASSSLLMAARVTGRKKVLVASSISVDKRSHMNNFCRPVLEIIDLKYDQQSGHIDLSALENNLTEEVAAVYFESPNYLGIIETQGEEIAQIAHKYGALCVVGVNPISLGVLEPPMAYGADIVCGDVQPFGLGMNYGGGLCGFISTSDDERFVAEHPSPPLSVFPSENGDLFFSKPTKRFSSYIKRESSPDFTGSLQTLSSITAGVYLALMGPEGLREIGETMIQRCLYAIKLLNSVPGVCATRFTGPKFNEFVVDFNATGKTVAEINAFLSEKGIFGGKDLSKEFPVLGESALYCVTEIHSAEDIKTLAKAIEEAVN